MENPRALKIHNFRKQYKYYASTLKNINKSRDIDEQKRVKKWRKFKKKLLK